MKDVKKLMTVFASVAILFACSNESSNVLEPTAPTNDVIEDELENEEAAFSFTYPLTGIGTDEQTDHRVVGVTVNNHPKARPQSGVIDADIVYEVLSEGEVTRLIALFHSKHPERVGPVRSSRPYHIDLVNGYNGMLVTHGWSPEAEQLLTSGHADYINGLFYDGTLFKRSSDRKAPHNSYITFDNIFEGLESRGYELSGNVPNVLFVEDEDADIQGAEGKEIAINYLNRNYVQYMYEEETKTYERFNDEDQTVDYESGKPIRLNNLFIVEAKHRVIDDVGRLSIDLDSGGKALLFQRGVAREIKWENDNGQIVPIQDGELVPLLPGQTWINIVPASPGIEQNVTY
ncbi:DUF3048 domain-containing protein [bacterium LRH843]|nr:DUF3048 domain-containing protein [bacterium LRH843]